MESVHTKILKAIYDQPRGTILFPSEFASFGSAEAIRLSFFRMERSGIIKRVSKGIYVRPKVSKLIGEVLPQVEDIAIAIAKRDKIRTLPTGSYALNALGLSTQVVLNIVLLTDGSPRVLKIGKRTIKFKKATPKSLAAKGKLSRLVIQALKEIGKENITEEQLSKILELLLKESKKDLMHDIPLAPVWIQNIMKKAV